MADSIGVIPARFASTRFLGKPLVEILGMTMIERVYTQAAKAKSLHHVIVATDDHRIFEHVKSFGGEVVMTSPLHVSGTDRCAEVVAQLGGNRVGIVVNIQGDEPFIEPEQIDKLVGLFANAECNIGTLVKRIADAEDLHSNTVIKVVRDLSGKALYFSRNAIPHVRGVTQEELLDNVAFFKHIGIYAYRAEVLKKLAALPVSELERTEGLEQLRWMENGYAIYLAETEHESNSVDTPEDLERTLASMARQTGV